MGLFDFRRKKPEPIRTDDGKFTAKTPITLEKRVETEQKALSGTVEVMNSIYGIMEKQEAIMNAKVEAALASGYEPEGPESDGILAIAMPILEQLAPHIGPYIGPLLEKYAGVNPQTIMPTAAGQAATTSPLPGGPSPQQNAPDKLKIALALPDSMWTKENIRMVLEQNGMGGLDDKDIKRLAQKINKAF